MNYLKIERFPALGYACDEALNTLCTNLTFSGENVRKIMVTSCHEHEGKSFLTMNIMRTMAKFGKKVALVDCDLRRSMLASKYGIRFQDAEHNVGLSHYLAGMATMEDVIYQTNLSGAYMVPIGRKVSNPLPLLNSESFAKLLDYLKETMDYVIVDTPPIGTVIDGAQIAKNCDGTLFVVNYNNVRRRELIEAKHQVEQAGCPVLGATMNMVEFDSYLSRNYYYKSYYYSYYDKYYTKDAADEKRPRRARKEKKK